MKTAWKNHKAHDWKNFLPPARPSVSDLALIEKYLTKSLNENKNKMKIAILGSTVETRSLAHKYGAEVTVVDFSEEHYKILSNQHMTYRGEETLVLKDWREINFSDKFDFVFGDAVFNMLNSKDRMILFDRVASILKKEGLFITRNILSKPNMPKNWKEIVDVTSRNYPNVTFILQLVLWLILRI